MTVRLPRGIALLLAITGVVLLALSTYLEAKHLDVLQLHPIWANLLSGATGFCFGLLILSVVIGRVLESTHQRTLHVTAKRAHSLASSATVWLANTQVGVSIRVKAPQLERVADLPTMVGALATIESWCSSLEEIAAAIGHRNSDGELITDRGGHETFRLLTDVAQAIRVGVEIFRRSLSYDSAVSLLATLAAGFQQLIDRGPISAHIFTTPTALAAKPITNTRATSELLNQHGESRGTHGSTDAYSH